ncbi:MAG: sugar phosphate isomerase/epimerase [Syntrophorhabdus sp.]
MSDKNRSARTILINAPYALVRSRLQLIRELDVGVEIYFNNDIIQEIQERDVEETGKILRSEGIPCTVHAPFMDLSPGAVDKQVRAITKDKLKKATHMANKLGALGIVCHPGYDKWRFGDNVDIWMEGSIETWTEVLAVAGDKFPVMVENIFEEEPDTIVELLKYFKDKILYFCCDSGHFNLFSNVPIDKWMTSLGNKTREMHLHDNYGSYDDHFPIGQGTVPFKELKVFLKSYNGNLLLTAEIHDESHAAQGIKSLKEYIS